MQNTTITTAAGVTMPRMLYGTAWKKERTRELVLAAIQAGFRGIDTAAQPRHYEEVLVGAALQEASAAGVPREALFVQTKFTPAGGQDPASIPYDPQAPLEEQVRQSVLRSLSNLHTPFVDSLLLHSPLGSHAQTMRVWQALEEAVEQGRARQLGISNCYDPAVFRAIFADARIKPAVVQNRFYAQTGYDTVLRSWCAENGVTYQGFWTLTANPHILVSETVVRMAQRHGRTEAQIFYRYLTQSGIVPLNGTTSTQHMLEDLDIFSFTLEADETAAISRLLRPA